MIPCRLIAATQIGLDLHLLTKATGAALIAAGLLSVLIFPILALTILQQDKKGSAPASVPMGEGAD